MGSIDSDSMNRHANIDAPIASDSRIEGLDELRGIAVLMVLVHHLSWLVGNYQIGGFAVDLFFIISGFLIGRILMRSRDDGNYYMKFYTKRIFRIAPLAVATVIFCWVLSKIIGWNTQSITYYIFFIQNYIPPQIVTGTHPDWGGHLAGSDPLWSLAVEEHFYLIVPFLIRWNSGPILIIICLIAGAASIIFKNFYLLDFGGYQWYSNPHRTECRFVYLVSGLMLNFGHVGYWVLGCFSVVWFLTRQLLNVEVGNLDLLGFIALVVIVALTILQKLRIRSSVLAWIGKLCFGIYLIHMPISLTLKSSPLASYPLVVVLIYFSAVFLLAHFSYRFFEEPIRKWGYRKVGE